MTETEQNVPSTPPMDEEDLDAIIDKLDETKIEADREIGEDDNSDDSASRPSSGGTNGKDEPHAPTENDSSNANTRSDTNTNGASSSMAGNGAADSKDKDAEKKRKNPFKFLKRLSSSGRDKAEKEKEEQLKKKEKLERVLTSVKVDTLPQTFVTKYLGNHPSKGLYGIKFTREPVENLVGDISNAKKGANLPLFSVQVSTRGLLIKPHKANKAKDIPIDTGLLPIEFISYGVQDVKYTRIFSYIVVREMSSKSKVLECHALLCDSVVTARRLALAMALAFKEYAKTLQGKPYKFKVDLRAPEEVEKDLKQVEDKEEVEEEDCDV